MNRVRGFTLVELITVIIILGILAAVAAPRFFDRNVFASRGFHDQVIATLRHAQKTAIAQRRFVCVAFSAASIPPAAPVIPGTVTLTTGADNTCGTDLIGPAGDSPYVIRSNNASFGAIPAGGNISFDCLGRPRNVGGGVACSDTSVATSGILTASTPITINGYGASIIVERETGYVHSP